MKAFISRFAEARARRVRYNHTVAEIRNMPKDVALDLGISTADAEQIARKHVYG